MLAKNGPVCVSVINMKGGVGKTTIAALLGRYASRRLGLKVIAIDLDPQANLSQAFMGDRYRQFLNDRDPSVVEIFKGFRPAARNTGAPRPLDVADVLVGNTRLGGANLQLVPFITTAEIVAARRGHVQFGRLRKRRQTTSGKFLRTRYLFPGDFRRSCAATSAIRETPCSILISQRSSSNI